MQTKLINLRTNTIAIAEFNGDAVRERAAGEAIHYHDDSHDPEDKTTFSAICRCGCYITMGPLSAVWTNKETSWAEHPARCK